MNIIEKLDPMYITIINRTPILPPVFSMFRRRFNFESNQFLVCGTHKHVCCILDNCTTCDLRFFYLLLCISFFTILCSTNNINIPSYYTFWAQTSNFGGLYSRALRQREKNKILPILETSLTAWYGSSAFSTTFFEILGRNW